MSAERTAVRRASASQQLDNRLMYATPVAGDSRDFPKFLVQVLISLVFIALGAAILFGHYNADLQKVASGWLGLILGYWLS